MALFQALKRSWNYDSSIEYFDFYLDEESTHVLHAGEGPNNSPSGICWDGTNFWSLDHAKVVVFKYTAAWVIVGAWDDWPLNALNSGPTGICWDGTNFWVTDNVDDQVYKYTSAWVFVEAINLHANNDDAYGVCWDGTYFYVTDSADDLVYKYTSAWVFVDTRSVVGTPKNIEWDGSDYFYVGSDDDDRIYKYDEDWVLQSDSFNVELSVGDCNGIAFDGTYYYLTNAVNDTVYKFDFSLGSNRVKTVGGHRNAIILYDGMVALLPVVEQAAGNVEFYLRAIDVTEKTEIQLKDTTGNICIRVKIDTSKIIGDGSDALDPAVNHTWYLLRIDFDSAPNTYDLYVDEAPILNDQAFGVNDDGNGITSLEVSMDTDENGYIDGIGHDWDAGYTQGDNVNDTVDVTADIIYAKITEEYKKVSSAEIRIKGSELNNFEAGQEISFYDSDSVLSWTGLIIYPENVLEGEVVIGHVSLVGIDSLFSNVFRKDFTNLRDSDYILKYIIDNGLTHHFSYNDEIDNFTLTYKYDLKTKIQKMFNHLTMLERAVLHYKPDGEIFFNKYDNLTASGLSWSQADRYVRVMSYTPAANRHITQAPVIGAYNDLGQVYYVGRATDIEEDQYGVNKMPAWRDPEITNYTEAKQLGDNLQTIYSLDTQVIKLLVQGEKHIQVGYTIELAWTGLFDIPINDFLVKKREWYPMIDRTNLELTSNIITGTSFITKLTFTDKIYDDDAQQSFDDSDIAESTVDGTVATLTSVARLRLFDPDNIKLDDINNPSGDTHFQFANKHLHFTWVAPVPDADSGAFEIEASGAFTRDLIHIHQHTGNPGPTNLVHIEATDTDVKCLHMMHGAAEFDFADGGLQLGGAGGRITVFDTAALAASDTKVPTNTTVIEYVNLRLLISEIDDVPVDGVVIAPISSNWAFDHAASPANIKHLTDAQLAALHATYTNAQALAAVGMSVIRTFNGLVDMANNTLDNIGNTSTYITGNDMYLSAHMRVRDGHTLYISSAGNDKVLQIIHNDTNTVFYGSSGNFSFQPSADTGDYLTMHTSSNNCYFRASGAPLYVGATSHLYFQPGNVTKWILETNGNLYPSSANQWDIGTSNREPREIYHCGLTATTCADFMEFNMEQIKEFLTWEAHVGLYEEMKNGTLLPHINIKTVHPILSERYEGHEEIKKVYDNEKKKWKDVYISKVYVDKPFFKDIDGNTQTVRYNIGDQIGIDFENLSYAHNAMILKQYEKILELEERINQLELNN